MGESGCLGERGNWEETEINSELSGWMGRNFKMARRKILCQFCIYLSL